MFSKKELALIMGTPKKKSTETFVKDIRKNTRRIFTAEQKILIVMEGLRAETSVAELCRKHSIAQSQFYAWNKEFMEDGLSQLSALKELPAACIIDLDFYDKNVLKQLQEFKTKYPSIKLIAHSDIDNEKIGKTLLDIGFSSYLLIGTDTDGFKKVIERVSNG